MRRLDEIRREYGLGQLSGSELAADPLTQFQHWFQQAKAAELSTDPTAMVLATCADNQPTQRVVLLKGLDPAGFIFYTNLGSQKARQLAVNPRCHLHFSWLPLERQVQIAGEAEQLSEAENAAYFHSRPRSSQLAAWASAQSEPVAGRSELDAQYSAMAERFADQEVPLPPFWGGFRVRPEQLEFWQGRQARLHDRFRYTWDNHQWHLTRLQP